MLVCAHGCGQLCRTLEDFIRTSPLYCLGTEFLNELGARLAGQHLGLPTPHHPLPWWHILHVQPCLPFYTGVEDSNLGLMLESSALAPQAFLSKAIFICCYF